MLQVSKKQNKTVSLDGGLHKELKILAAQRECELAELLNDAVREFLVRNSNAMAEPKQR